MAHEGGDLIHDQGKEKRDSRPVVSAFKFYCMAWGDRHFPAGPLAGAGGMQEWALARDVEFQKLDERSRKVYDDLHSADVIRHKAEVKAIEEKAGIAVG
jgi:hypothetical protein